jgi:WS/DGAT/MGAT family acyltransferase
MDRLTAVDAGFLDQERGGAHLHVGAILICDGPRPRQAEMLDHLRARLSCVPRYRQRLAQPPFALGKPYWVDDPDFNLAYHVRHTALPTPGGAQELRRLAGRIFAQRLDRTKPLWELWVIEGLEEGRFALINKTHHAVVDGVSGIDITTALFDLQPDTPASPAPKEQWSPPPPPTGVELVANVAREAAGTPLRVAKQAAYLTTTPRRALRDARRIAGGLGDIAAAMGAGATSTSLNGPIGPHREIAWIELDLAEIKAIKNGLGGTVNDVFLAVMAGAIRGWLRSRGELVDGLRLRACVPVSVRTAAEHGALGNRIVAMFAPLPVGIDDPVERIATVTREMDGLKESGQAVGADAIAAVEELAPPTILAQASRLQFSTRMYNVLLSNVPGPQFPVYVLGKELRSFIPVAFLAEDKRLAVAIVSYNGHAVISVIADSDHVHDLPALMDDIRRSVAELEEAVAAGRRPRVRRKRAS